MNIMFLGLNREALRERVTLSLFIGLLEVAVHMNSVFWRYLLLLSLLYIFWGQFFVAGGVINQVAFNFALFYPLGFWVGYRHQAEHRRTAYLTAFIFNLLSYVVASVLDIPIESWLMVVLDFFSLFMVLKVGMYLGRRTQLED